LTERWAIMPDEDDASENLTGRRIGSSSTTDSHLLQHDGMRYGMRACITRLGSTAMSITIHLPAELEAELRARLDAQDVELSEFVREAIAEKLDREAPGRPSGYELDKSVFGKHGSGRDDLSTNRKAILGHVLSAKRPH
jgi:hypothetical protein